MNTDKIWAYALKSLQKELGDENVNRYLAVCELERRGVAFCIKAPDDEVKAWIADNALGLIESFLRKFDGTSYVFLESIPEEEKIEIAVHEARQTLYQEIVSPRRIIVVPAYFRWWIPIIGPELAWMYIAFRQLAYLRTGGGKKNTHSVFVSVSRLAKMLGITRYGLYKRLNNPLTWQKMQGLVSRNTDNPQKYTVSLSLPLTPHHAASLASLLTMFSCFNPEWEDLQSFCNSITPEELSDNGTAPASTPNFIPAIVDDSLPKMRGDARALLASMLQEKLIPQNDIFLFTHFFFEKIMPIIGDAQAWLYLLLRKNAYDSNDIIQEIAVPGGFVEMANWLGFSRPRTIYEYFKDVSPFSVYASLSNSGAKIRGGLSSLSTAANRWSQGRRIRILCNDLPQEAFLLALEQNADIRQIDTFGALNLSDSPDKYTPKIQDAVKGFLEIVQTHVTLSRHKGVGNLTV